jgi:hypothetical protein
LGCRERDSDEERPEAFAGWLGEQMGGSPVRFEKVAPGDEQILEDREQRDLDAVPSFLALPDESASLCSRHASRYGYPHVGAP